MLFTINYPTESICVETDIDQTIADLKIDQGFDLFNVDGEKVDQETALKDYPGDQIWAKFACCRLTNPECINNQTLLTIDNINQGYAWSLENNHLECIEAFKTKDYSALIYKYRVYKSLPEELITEQFRFNLLRRNSFLIEDMPEREDFQLFAVKRNGLALQKIKDASGRVELEAVREDPYAIEYVKNQTKEICDITIQLDPLCLFFIKDPSLKLCKTAIKLDYHSICYVPVKFKTPELLDYVLKINPNGLEFFNNPGLVHPSLLFRQ